MKKAANEKSLHLATIGVFHRGVWKPLTCATNQTSRLGETHRGHAEREAIRKLKKMFSKKVLNKMNLYMTVSRMKGDGSVSMSKPCEKCSNYLTSCDLKLKVFYTTNC